MLICAQYFVSPPKTKKRCSTLQLISSITNWFLVLFHQLDTLDKT